MIKPLANSGSNLQPAMSFSPLSDFRILEDSSRLVQHAGRTGLTFDSIRGRAAIDDHLLSRTSGTLAQWVLPLQSLAPAAQYPAHRRSNPYFDRFVFLSDREAVQEIETANFVFFYHSSWHPVLIAKFAQSALFQALFSTERSAIASAGHFEMRAFEWYQMALAWDHASGRHSIYANGVKVGSSDSFLEEPLPHDTPARCLYFGSPAYAMGDISFFDKVLEQDELRVLFEKQSAHVSLPLQRALSRTYEGAELGMLDEKPTPQEGWSRKLAAQLNREADYHLFYHQGCGPSVGISAEGLRVTTPGFDIFGARKSQTPTGDELDMTRMYLWSRQTFEGDIYVSFDFRLNQHGGLALLMTQAAGMQGEDFLKDYPLRSTGSMSVVHREDVRNYHWEFYREMIDTRNDLVCHACLKNPWFRPMAFQIENRKWELNQWYRLEFLQCGERLRGAINGVCVIDVRDSPTDNNGPILQKGRIALRVMMRSDITFRNLEVWSRSQFDGVGDTTSVT